MPSTRSHAHRALPFLGVALAACNPGGSSSAPAPAGSTSAAAAPAPTAAPGEKLAIRRVFKAGAVYSVETKEATSKRTQLMTAEFEVKEATCKSCTSSPEDPGFSGLLRLIEYGDAGEPRKSPNVIYAVEGVPRRKDWTAKVTAPNPEMAMWERSRSLHALMGDICPLTKDFPDLAPGQREETTYNGMKLVYALEKIEREGDKAFAVLTHEWTPLPDKKADHGETWRARISLEDGFTGTCHHEFVAYYKDPPETTTFDVTVKRTR
ncbi:hypothetical protein [Polyangium sorediatum]|uniref:Lipoprotein n=1 Tax=Polyangium sorediatum TaxID=889274 RepID=A0ABT6P9M7_9BACT|nr:hypothetical protein [Polyangium sorediatum]MDI1437335.1 hypothetical protein [Polyangium sorediatum]